MKQVSFLRGHVIPYLKRLRVYLSCLPELEDEALQRLSGVRDVQTAARNADLVLAELGHEPPQETPKQSPTMRQARRAMDESIDVLLSLSYGEVLQEP